MVIVDQGNDLDDGLVGLEQNAARRMMERGEMECQDIEKPAKIYRRLQEERLSVTIVCTKFIYLIVYIKC